MKFYKDSDGLWILGDAIVPAGTCFIETLANGDIAISFINGRNVIYNGPVTDLIKENDDAYVDMAELLTSCGDFFVKAVTDGGTIEVISTSVSGTQNIELVNNKLISHSNTLVDTDIITLSLGDSNVDKVNQFLYEFKTGLTAPVINLPAESKDVIFIDTEKKYLISFVRISENEVFIFYKEEAI